MKVTLRTHSYTLVGSGEGTGLIDSDVIFDEQGIPFIPARRLKGLLRESATEVCEILDKNKNMVNYLFGKPGTKEGALSFENLLIQDYEGVKRDLRSLKDAEIFHLSKERLIQCFTAIRQQTAIDPETGTALEHSLRTYRVLKPGITFEGQILSREPLPKSYEALLILSCINLRRIGVRRNRGFGRIKIRVENSATELEKLLQQLDSPDKCTASSKEALIKETDFTLSGKISKLPYTIKTLSPVVLAKPSADMNTVDTYKFIPGSTVRGTLANAIITNRSLSSAHEDRFFFEAFLSNRTLFGNAFPFLEGRVFFPTPMELHAEKNDKESKFFNWFNLFYYDGELHNPKQIGGFSSFSQSELTGANIETMINFHGARDRVAGKNLEGSIFYYESVPSGTEFKGTIIGDEAILNGLVEILGKEFEAKIGKSKSAQYGQVQVQYDSVEEFPPVSDNHDKEFVLTLLSPGIFYNEWGYPDPSIRCFKTYLEASLGATVESIEAFTKTESFENHVGIWGCSEQRELAFSPGSSFHITLKEGEDHVFLSKLAAILERGLGERTAEGFGQIALNASGGESSGKFRKLESVTFTTKAVPEICSKTLDLLKESLKSSLISKLRGEAFRTAEKNRGTITNHLISRLKDMISISSSTSEFVKRFRELNDKTAGKQLKKAALWEPLLSISEHPTRIADSFGKEAKIERFGIDLSELVPKYEACKIYWLCFLDAKRLMNKLMKKKGSEKDG